MQQRVAVECDPARIWGEAKETEAISLVKHHGGGHVTGLFLKEGLAFGIWEFPRNYVESFNYAQQ